MSRPSFVSAWDPGGRPAWANGMLVSWFGRRTVGASLWGGQPLNRVGWVRIRLVRGKGQR